MDSFRLCLPESAEERANLASNSGMENFRAVVSKLKERYLPYHEGKLVWESKKEGVMIFITIINIIKAFLILQLVISL